MKITKNTTLKKASAKKAKGKATKSKKTGANKTKAELKRDLEKASKQLKKFKAEKAEKARIRRGRKKGKLSASELKAKQEREESRAEFLVKKYAREDKHQAYEQNMLDALKERQKLNPDKFKGTFHSDLHFAIEKNCFEALEEAMYPNGEVTCRHCGWNKVYLIETRNVYKCARCRKTFSRRGDGIFRWSKIPLTYWFKILMAENIDSTKLTIRQVRDILGVTQKTAVSMLHRIRYAAFTQTNISLEADKPVALDTTAIFGANVNRHDCKKLSRKNIAKRSAQFMTFKQNEGNALILGIPNLTEDAKKAVITPNLPVGVTAYTDEHPAFRFLGESYKHETVNHSLGEHGREEVSNNGAESVHAALKSALKAHFNCFRKEHLQLFVNAIVFQKNTNNRKLTAQEKFKLSLQNIVSMGKPVRIKIVKEKPAKRKATKPKMKNKVVQLYPERLKKTG